MGWDGYQCGFCGAEFKTESELTRHQITEHNKPIGNLLSIAFFYNNFDIIASHSVLKLAKISLKKS